MTGLRPETVLAQVGAGGGPGATFPDDADDRESARASVEAALAALEGGAEAAGAGASPAAAPAPAVRTGRPTA
jgi:hypothetical protein